VACKSLADRDPWKNQSGKLYPFDIPRIIQLHSTARACSAAIMTRAQQTISIGLLLASLYLSCYIGLVPLSDAVRDEVIPVLPLWAIVSFGAYLLFKLGWGVFTFNDVPEAYDSLMKEIDTARADLRKKGVSVD